MASSKGRRFPVEILTDDEIKALLRACSERAPTGVRNRALLAVLWRAGLRVSEALALRPKDYDGEPRTLRVLHGKGDKARTVALDDTAHTLLARWMDRREMLGFNGRHPIFCTLKGRPLQTSYTRQLLPRLAERAGVEKRVHPHGLRHAFAAGLMAEGKPFNKISAALGHNSVATTAVYLNHIQPQEVVDMLTQRDWVLEE